jgi:hypothetical protein
MGLRFLRADENILWGASVAATVGSVASTYLAAYLCDGRNRPVKMTSGTATLTATPLASGYVSVVIAHSHNIDALRTITIGGSVSAAVTAPVARTNLVPVNPWIDITTPAIASSVSIAVASNSASLVIGELLGGRARELANDIPLNSFQSGYLEVGTVEPRNPMGSVVPYPRGLCARWFRGDVFCEEADRQEIEDWFEGQREGQRPSVVLPMHAENDAWVGTLLRPTFRAFESGWLCTLEFREWARKRW